MQIKIFSLPVLGGERLTEDLNVFLRSKRILQVREHLVSTEGEGTFLCFIIRYIDDVELAERERGGRVDYRELLDEASFKRFSALRQIRKKVAQDDAVPPYAVFTDQELAELARIELLSPEAMKKIKGIGEKKIEKYGQFFVNLPKDEKSDEPVA
jgi:superfamily II DNA helicase RecQ